jgi:uncharacterized protein DUF4232
MKLLLVPIAAAAAAAVSVAAAAPPGNCSASQLRAHVLGSNGAAGTIGVSITLTNTAAACTLKGYAGLRLRNAKGPLPTTVVHGGLAFLRRPQRLVTLARGGKASVLIAYNHVPSGNGPCPTATRLLVKPPGAAGWVAVALRLDPCRRGTVYESPVLAGVQPVA